MVPNKKMQEQRCFNKLKSKNKTIRTLKNYVYVKTNHMFIEIIFKILFLIAAFIISFLNSRCFFIVLHIRAAITRCYGPTMALSYLCTQICVFLFSFWTLNLKKKLFLKSNKLWHKCSGNQNALTQLIPEQQK